MKAWLKKYLVFFITPVSVATLVFILFKSGYLNDSGGLAGGYKDQDKLSTMLTEQTILREEVKALHNTLINFRDQYLDNRQDVIRNMQLFSNYISTETQLRSGRAEQTRAMHQKIRNIEEYLNIDREYRQIYQGDVREIRQDLRELSKTLIQIERHLSASETPAE